MRKRSKKHLVSVVLLLLILAVGVLKPAPVQAASFKNAKPKIDTKKSAYLNNKIYLKWSKVSGAKKYEIQRAKINPSTGKAGKWVKWKTVKKTQIKTKGSGDYKYRVRAVKGKTKSKWSPAKRIFAASATITNVGATPPVEYDISYFSDDPGMLEFRVLIKNKTKSDMGFLQNYKIGVQNTVYAINKSTGKVVKKLEADLDVSGAAKLIPAGKTESIYLTVYGISVADWAKIKDCKYMISTSFYPNPEVEPVSTQMSVAYTAKQADSSVAVK